MVEDDPDYHPFQRINGRWPRIGDRIFSPGDDAWPAKSLEERNYRLGAGYKRAGDVLAQNLFGEARDHDNLMYPILFCYRHYIEIALKEIIERYGQWVNVVLRGKKDHELPKLWKLFLQIAVAYGNDPSYEAAQAVSACIEEFANYDPNGFAFRYATDNSRRRVLIPLEFGPINLVNLHDVMNGIANFLECAESDFAHKWDAACEAASYYE